MITKVYTKVSRCSQTRGGFNPNCDKCKGTGTYIEVSYDGYKSKLACSCCLNILLKIRNKCSFGPTCY